MVEPTFLAISAVVFFLILVLILRSGASGEHKPPKKDRKSKPVPQKIKQKKPRTSLKKGDRPVEPTEWEVEGAGRDAQDVLEFLKGKDPNELAKQHGQGTKQGKKKAKKAREEALESDESGGDSVASDEGFEEVKKKVVIDKKKKKKDNKKKVEEPKEKAKKPYFKPLKPEEGGPEVKEEQRKGKRERRSPVEGAEEGAAERRGRPEGEKRERKPRPEGERRERKPRLEGECERSTRRPIITSPPNVKYEEADLNDILNSITQDFQSKPQARRIPSVFSKIPRSVVVKIISKLGVRDLISLSEVNHYFMGIARNNSFWKDLYLRDFGLRDPGAKNLRHAYITEYKKRKIRKSKEEGAGAPQGEEKDTKPKPKAVKKEVKKEEPATEQTAAQKE